MEANPSTAIGAETAGGKASSRNSTPTRRRKRRRKYEPNFNIPGVHKVILGELTQKIIGCVAGENVTVEKPWIYVDKDLLTDNLEAHSESSEFLPLRGEILLFPRQEVLLGYVPDESRDYDEFYICITEQATDIVKVMVEKMQRRQEERLKNAVNKQVYEWASLGSEREIEENIPRKNRPLIEVEIESKYPILPFKIHFRSVLSQDIKGGYMELVAGDDLQPSVFRKRVDVDIQVAPILQNNEAQTTCSYPSNSSTQYEYTYDLSQQEQATQECLKIMQQYIEDNENEFFDLLLVNESINLYSNDYEDLVINPNYTMKIKIQPFRKYVTFIKMDLCEGKYISCVTWHPLWTGLFLLAYVDVAAPIYLKSPLGGDVVNKTVHGSNPVLLWSFKDKLNPRLILESPREVFSISFCPYNENLVVGGLSNGQIIIWDLTNKLAQVEAEEILTSDQQKHRAAMYSLMNWMKNVQDLSKVRLTALSDLKHSHTGCVNSIVWMSPTHRILKTGKIEPCTQNTSSLQFITSGEDGCLLIWDLLIKPHMASGGFKAMRRSRRLKKRPDALVATLSPFKSLHLNLKPIYRINLWQQGEVRRPVNVACFFSKFFDITYNLVEKKKMKKLSERVFYEIESIRPKDPLLPEFYVGSLDGIFIRAKWDGQEFDSGEIVNFEPAQFINCAKYHDGPITNIGFSKVLHIFLTVGGKVFCLWPSDFKNGPLLWRKADVTYTFGDFYLYNQVALKLLRSDGYYERWLFFSKSKNCIYRRLVSDGSVNLGITHELRLKSNIAGACDHRGSCQLFIGPHSSPDVIAAMRKKMSDFVQNELQRKGNFLEWQDDWNKKYEINVEAQTQQKEKSKVEILIEHKPKQSEDKERKTLAKVDSSKKYAERARAEHIDREMKRIKDIVLTRKQLDPDKLVKERAPLKKLEAENEVKKRKQRAKHKDSDDIFKETVHMLFPDVMKEKPPPPSDPYAIECDSDDMERSFDKYKGVAIEALDFIDDHPFIYEFSWGNVLNAGLARRKRLDETYSTASHYKRYPSYKLQRDKEIATMVGYAPARDQDRTDEESELGEYVEGAAEETNTQSNIVPVQDD